ncbi:hypothetical protein [Roseiconus lacunae]|uniref:hypothetical protein n=1 Tax=Roseiconus lacunae TaxID=2605694 RepID=UPI001E32D619|nr:hypothetical protein [Roseiconus lacunae]
MLAALVRFRESFACCQSPPSTVGYASLALAPVGDRWPARLSQMEGGLVFLPDP